MHGELIELNEYLQRMLKSKDILMMRMRSELEQIRGPVSRENSRRERILDLGSILLVLNCSHCVLKITNLRKHCMTHKTWSAVFFFKGWH